MVFSRLHWRTAQCTLACTVASASNAVVYSGQLCHITLPLMQHRDWLLSLWSAGGNMNVPVTIVEALPDHKVLRAGYFSPYIDQARLASAA